ncbi:hypothetical protein [Irregularibacter muris]|uniref:hypothetical protein n=1 Tax=Irregularibacter muris TaxID=1796619 RepID=UPI00214AF4A2|nr:hypothetical protein [Irregularibacter muris]
MEEVFLLLFYSIFFFTYKSIHFVSRLKDNAKITEIQNLKMTYLTADHPLLDKESKIVLDKKVRKGIMI